MRALPAAPEWLIAEANVIEAHEAYLAIVDLVAGEAALEHSDSMMLDIS